MRIKQEQPRIGTVFKDLRQGDFFMSAIAGSSGNIYLVVRPETSTRGLAAVNLSSDVLVRSTSFRPHDRVRRVYQTNKLVFVDAKPREEEEEF